MFCRLALSVLNILPDGHYLNLPVVESDGRLVAIVDVLKLTYATLEQVGEVLSIGFVYANSIFR